MSEKKTGRRAPRRSRAEAAELVKEYEASGLSREAFCAQRGMGISTLVRYFRWRAEEAGGAKRRWVSVEVSAKERPVADGDGKLSVRLANGRRIEVSRGFDGAMLEQLLSVLERV
jgi:hypothetical protein